MAISTADATIINKAIADNQKVSLGTEVKAIQDAQTGILAGEGITLPTSDPSVAGSLWSNSGVVTVSAG